MVWGGEALGGWCGGVRRWVDGVGGGEVLGGQWGEVRCWADSGGRRGAGRTVGRR